MAAKLHAYSSDTEKSIPDWMLSEYRRQGLSGALCGYVRKTTSDDAQVTCFYCLKKLNAKRVKK